MIIPCYGLLPLAFTENLAWFNDEVLWKYFVIPILLGGAVYFTVRSRGVQFRMLPEMFRMFRESGRKEGNKKEKHISSFQAFMVSLAGRVGTGNLAGVATAIALGGPGAVFWMWVMATLGAATSFTECTLAQLYKVRSKDSYVGGPAYYIRKGLKSKWLAVVVAFLIILTFGFAINTVQSNTIADAMHGAFGLDPMWGGVILAGLTLLIIFGGIQRIAKVSGVIVPVMAVAYIIVALYVVITNLNHIPDVFRMIVDSAFGIRQAVGGTLGMAVIMGMKRGLFSNEAGMGSSPNVAATAQVSHPVKQGLVQALGVYTDTLLICSCTAFIILLSGVYTGSPEVEGVQLTQQAMNSQLGSFGSPFIAVIIFFFAFSTIFGNYYYGEANLRYITDKKWAMTLYRLLVGGIVMFGAVAGLRTVWNLADITMGFVTIFNMIAVILLCRQAYYLLGDYRSQKKRGIKSPEFRKDSVPDGIINKDEIECW